MALEQAAVKSQAQDLNSVARSLRELAQELYVTFLKNY